MLKKLRIKFVALNMATVALVLTVVFSAICMINYQQDLTHVRAALDSAVAHVNENGGMNSGASGNTNINESPFSTTTENMDTTQNTDTTENAPSTGHGQDFAPPEIGGKRDDAGSLVPVATYLVNADGSLTAVSARTTASIADTVLSQAATQLADAPEGTGKLDNLALYYEKRNIDGTTYLAFADTSSVNGWQSLALTLAGVGLAALVVFLIISIFFARWALRPVAQAWTQQQQFVADASHDLKTPLTVILANTSIVLEHPERSVASQSQWIESTQREAEGMQEMVGDLLMLAQVDEGTTQPSFTLLDLTDLVEGELLQFESVAFERNIAIDSNLDDNVQIQGDSLRVRRLTTTLLDNACKYADQGGCITVTLRQSVRSIELAVHNSGPAIPAEDLPHVFDRFYRADKARTHDNSGYGLGLAIAYAIAQEHGGALVVTSNAEQGTTFTWTLPHTPTRTQ